MENIPETMREVIRALQQMPEDDALDMLRDVAEQLGHWPVFFDVAGLHVLKPHDPTPEG